MTLLVHLWPIWVIVHDGQTWSRKAEKGSPTAVSGWLGWAGQGGMRKRTVKHSQAAGDRWVLGVCLPIRGVDLLWSLWHCFIASLSSIAHSCGNCSSATSNINKHFSQHQPWSIINHQPQIHHQPVSATRSIRFTTNLSQSIRPPLGTLVER